MKTVAIALLLLLAPYATSVQAAGKYQTHDSIRATARSVIEAHNTQPSDQVKINTHRLDRRLKLRACDLPLAGFLSSGSKTIGRTTVGVRCADAKPWTIYVTVTVDVFKSVLVTTKAIVKGAVIAEQDVQLVSKNVSSLRFGYLQSVDDLAGFVAKRNIQAGKILTKLVVAPPKMVRRGERVTILAGNRKFDVRMAGTAMMDGAIGNRIRVRNNRSKRVIEAVVTARGLVKVSL